MSGELNGTRALLLLGNGGDFSSIVGQMELTSTFNGTPIDVSSKSDSDFAALLDGELSGKGLAVSGSLVYSSDTSYEAVRAAERSKQITDFRLSFNNNNEIDLYLSGIVHSVADSAPLGDKLTSSFTITSTGDVFRAVPFIPSGEDSFVTSDGKTYQVRL